MKQSTAPFECVRYYDPAIDYPADGGTVAVEYAQYRDIKTLRYVDEAIARPMIFQCRRLTPSQRRHVKSAPYDSERFRRAFQYGVLSVQNYEISDGNFVLWEPRRKTDDALISEKQMEDFGDLDVDEIGSVIYAQSFLAQGVPLRCPLLDSSQAAYLAVQLRSAERKQASKTQTGTP
jgi:hypothetical protein